MSNEIHTRVTVAPFPPEYHSVLRTQAFLTVQRFNEGLPESDHLGWRFDPDACLFSVYRKSDGSPESAETIDLMSGEVALQGTGIIQQVFLAYLIVAEQRTMVDIRVETTASRSFLDSAFEIARVVEEGLKQPKWARPAPEGVRRSDLPETLDFRK